MRLRSLSLAGCDIGDAGCEAIFTALGSASANQLSELVLSGNRITGDGAVAIGAALSSPANCLAKLDLKVNPIGDAGARGIFIACRDSEHCKLVWLDLEQTGLGPEAATSLGAALRSGNCRLAYVSLNHNDPGVGDAGCKKIGAALKTDRHPSTLVELNLCRNGIGPRGAVAISEAVGLETSRLQRIWLLGNPFADTPQSAQMVASGFYGEIKLRKKHSPLREIAGVELWLGMIGGESLSNRDVLLVLCGKKKIKKVKEKKKVEKKKNQEVPEEAAETRGETTGGGDGETKA